MHCCASLQQPSRTNRLTYHIHCLTILHALVLRHEPPQPAHVYVPEVTTLAGEAAVFRDLDEGQAPRPEHSDIIRSAGAAGLLMRFSRPTMVGLVLHALQLPPRPASPGAPPPFS